MRTPILSRLVGRSTSLPPVFSSVFSSARDSLERLVARPVAYLTRCGDKPANAYVNAWTEDPGVDAEKREMQPMRIERTI
jgi:hypothetical protein